MRIAFLTPEYPPYGLTGGIGSYVSIIAPTLAARGHEVHVVVCAGSGSADVADGKVEVHLRPLQPIPLLSRVDRVSQTHDRAAAARSYAAAVREVDEPDVVESPEWMAESLRIRGTARRARLVVHLHTPVGLIAHHGARLGRDAALANLLEIRSIKGARAVTSPSRLLLDLLFPRGVPQETLARVIRLPVDMASWTPPDRSRRTERVVLVVGRLERLKGVDILLEAAGDLPPDVRATTTIVAVGRSSGLHEGRPYAEWLSTLADRHEVRFQHRAEVSRQELAGIYATARILALPSRFDNFPTVALEAMASGVPVVCSTACGTAELIDGTGAGEVFPAEDRVALTTALLRYLEDEAAAKRAGTIGRQLVEKECAPDAVAAQREQLYREMTLR